MTDLERFNSFKKKHRLAYEDVKKIATEYAESEGERACSYFTKKYDLTNHVFYKIRDFAIVCCLIDERTCYLIKDKASSNKQESGSSSLRHFESLMERRKTFLNESFSKEEITDIAYKYADGNSLDSIANVYEICPGAVKKLLAIGTMRNIIPTELINSIEKRLVSYGKKLESFEDFKKIRKNNQKKILEPLKQEKMVLEYQISSYEDYFFEDENVPSIDFLKNRFEEVTKKISELETD